MDAVLKSVSLGFLLRSFVAGSFFVLSYFSVIDGVSAILTGQSSITQLGAIQLALLSGITMYVLHRSLIYTFIEWPLNCPVVESYRNRMPLISDATVSALKYQWELACKQGEERQVYAKHITVWADYVHLQYVSGECIAAGALVRAIAFPSAYPWNPPMVALAMIFIIGAVTSDWRLHRVREVLKSTT